MIRGTFGRGSRALAEGFGRRDWTVALRVGAVIGGAASDAEEERVLGDRM